MYHGAQHFFKLQHISKKKNTILWQAIVSIRKRQFFPMVRSISKRQWLSAIGLFFPNTFLSLAFIGSR